MNDGTLGMSFAWGVWLAGSGAACSVGAESSLVGEIPPGTTAVASGSVGSGGMSVGDSTGEQTTGQETPAGETSSSSGSVSEHEAFVCPDGGVIAELFAGEAGCAALAPRIVEAANEHCALGFGWLNECADCDDPPQKVGVVGGRCEVLAGDHSECATQFLAGVGAPGELELLGINTDGDVGPDDRLFAGFGCAAIEELTEGGTRCPEGMVAVGVDPLTGLRCSPIDLAVANWASEHCLATLAWAECENCAVSPTLSVGANAAGCTNTSHCPTIETGGGSFSLGALHPGHSIDGNDTFYLSLACDEAVSESEAVQGTMCPEGSFVHGWDERGALICGRPFQQFSNTMRERCSAYLGWRDSCNDCVAPPSRWAGVTATGCSGSTPGARCMLHEVDGAELWMASVGMSGNVDGDDKFYVGFQCE